jgi:hypothetical protein
MRVRWRGTSRLTDKSVLLAAFLMCALPLGVMSALLTPPGQVPDEPNQARRAAGLLHGAVFAVRKEVPSKRPGLNIVTAGVKVDRGLYQAAFEATTPIDERPVVTAADEAVQRAKPAVAGLVFAKIPNTAQYFPAPYIPAALGMALGEGAGLTPFHSFVLARLAMLVAFLTLGAASLWVAGWGEAVLLAVLIMPMTVFLAGSVNADGVLIGLACLGVACLTRAGGRWRAGGLACLAVLLGTKITDFPILALALLPLAPAGCWGRMRAVALAGAPVALWWGLVIAFVSVRFYMPPYHPGPLFLGDPATLLYQTDPSGNARILLHPASRLITLPWAALRDGGTETLRQMIGVLGLLQIRLQHDLYLAWGVALVVAIGGTAVVPRAGAPRAFECVFVLALVVAIYVVTQIAEYIGWSAAGADQVQGMQGRYLLPVLPMLIFAVPRWRGGLLAGWVPAIPAVMLGVFDIAYLPLKLVYFFYLH